MSTEQNKALMRQLMEEIFNRGNVGLADELLAPDFLEREELPPGVPPGRDGVKALATMFRSAFPDFKVTVNDMIAEDDKVTVRSTWSGTQTGEFMGIPATGRCVSFGAIDIIRVAGGRLAEHWGQMDNTRMMQQLGVIPAPGEGKG